MSVNVNVWEQSLRSLALEAWHSKRPTYRPALVDQPALTRAYAHCAQLTRFHSRSFYLASSLLPAEKRSAVRALYAFCRVSDDLVDYPLEDPIIAITNWRLQTQNATPDSVDPVTAAWADTQARYQIPHGYAEQLLNGVTRDLYQNRYQTFDDLVTYAYGVASTVGLMSMHIIGFSGPEALPYAIKLGVALQLTNILRDVGEDWRSGRVYLPQEELAAFNLTEEDLAAGRIDERWRAFMRFQIERTRRLYTESWPGIALLGRDGRFAIAAAAHLYQGILDDIEAHDYDVFSRRAYIGGWRKLRRLVGLWLRSLFKPEYQ